jgi:hypothetical protein
MAITNNNAVVVDLPVWEVLQPFPVAIGSSYASGVCCCADLRGNNRYIYWLFSATQFWRYDTYANTWQQLSNPPGGTVGAGTEIIFDPSRGTSGYVWALIANGSASPTWQYYDITANTWTARAVANLPAAPGTDSALAHTCTTYNVSGNDDYIYLVTNASTTFYRFSISGNAWVNTLTVQPSAPGAGCRLVWQPGWNTDRLLRIRGGGYNTIDYYSITGNNWTGLTYNPSSETLTTGTHAIQRGINTDQVFIQKDATQRIFCFDCGDLTLIPQSTQYLITPSTAYVGNRMTYVKESNNIEYIYMMCHYTQFYLRTALFF